MATDLLLKPKINKQTSNESSKKTFSSDVAIYCLMLQP
jgi:hypothetical protein